jgi:predicted metal-dependent phosphoesterase TrpH
VWLAEQVNDAAQEYLRADRAEKHAQQARDRVVQATFGAAGTLSLAEQARTSQEAGIATEHARARFANGGHPGPYAFSCSILPSRRANRDRLVAAGAYSDG